MKIIKINNLNSNRAIILYISKSYKIFLKFSIYKNIKQYTNIMVHLSTRVSVVCPHSIIEQLTQKFYFKA